MKRNETEREAKGNGMVGYNIDYYVKSSINDPSNMGFKSIHHDFLITIEFFRSCVEMVVLVAVTVMHNAYIYIHIQTYINII